MQVFIVGTPFETATSLSPRHLNNQINEAKVILDALNGAKAWSNHPCVLQYRGHEKWLENYRACLLRYYHGEIDRASTSNRWCEIIGKPPFHTTEYFKQMKRRLYTKDPVYYEQWAHLGKSEDNWYFVNNEWRIYRNGKRVE